METLDVFGKLKPKELSFGLNDVRRVNKREERLLRNALGSIEKQRKRSLLRIQNEVEDLHVSLKETNNVWQEDWKNSGHDENKVQEALRCRVPANDMKNERFHEFGKQNDSTKASISFEETSEQREPSDPGSRAVQRYTFQDVKSSNTLNKTQRTERLLTRARNTSTGSLLNTLHQNTVNCFQDLRKTASNSDVDKMVSRDASSLAISQAISSSELSVSGRMSQDGIFHYTRPCCRRAVSTGCISLSSKDRPITAPYFSPQVKQKKISADIGNFYISRSKTNSPVPIRKVGASRSSCGFINVADSSPVSRRAGEERRTSNSAVGHKKVEKVISCPQLHCSQKETRYRTLWSMNGERSLSRRSTELPGLQTGHEVRNVSKQDEREHCYRCVSPNNLERAMMDKNLQNRINAFLSSLTENDHVSAGETE